jgi:hypothetical protein
MSEFIRINKGTGWGKVNRHAMDDTQLSIGARGVLSWFLTRPDDHRIILIYAKNRMCLNEARWKKYRDELKKLGYLSQERVRQENGQVNWVYTVNDCPSEK